MISNQCRKQLKLTDTVVFPDQSSVSRHPTVADKLFVCGLVQEKQTSSP